MGSHPILLRDDLVGTDVLEVEAFDGRARNARWTPSEGQDVRTPALLVPETSFAPVPAWARAVLTTQPKGRAGVVELVSGGTWFHPREANGATLVVPPIQPAPSTVVQLVAIGDEMAAFHDAVGWASNPKSLVPAFIEARRLATPARLLWAPGLGTPADYALWAYLGVDAFDASALLLAAARGQALTTDGLLSADEAGRLLGDGEPWDAARLAAHNLEAARRELELVRHHIAKGTLRALVERRVYTSAASVEILRRFDREHHFLEAAAPRHRAIPLPAMTSDAVWMPEVEAFRRSFRGSYEPPRTPKVLVLLPCSQRKPYKMSRSHRAFARVLDDSGVRPLLHEVMITSPLGLVPRELEEAYPASQYDIPVTGHWTRDEEAVVRDQLAALLSKRDYDHVIVHSGQGTFDVLRDLLPEHVRHTCLKHPTSPEDLERLKAELARLRETLGGVDAWKAGRDRKLEDLRALATFQFGATVADELATGAEAHGRMPFVKLVRKDGDRETQLAMTTPERGVLSLTLDGARILARHGHKRVRIGDFRPKGTSSLFAVGVEGADPDVREGDEVVVVHGDDVRAVGVARMSAEAMTHLKRGVAVTLRHTAATAKRSNEPTEPTELVSVSVPSAGPVDGQGGRA
jgi:archaeosine synthase